MENNHVWEKLPVARKPHKCIICKQVILPGTKYVSKTVVTDAGTMKRSKFHIPCEDHLNQRLEELDQKIQSYKSVMEEAWQV